MSSLWQSSSNLVKLGQAFCFIYRKMDIKIVASQADILSAIADLNKIIFSDRGRHGHYALKIYQERLIDKKYFIFTAWAGKQLVGDAVSYVLGDSLYLWILGVKEDFRRRGIAKKLLESTKKIAQENNLSQITTKVYDVSPEMKNLLLKIGFKLERVEASEKDSKYNTNYYFFKLR